LLGLGHEETWRPRLRDVESARGVQKQKEEGAMQTFPRQNEHRRLVRVLRSVLSLSLSNLSF